MKVDKALQDAVKMQEKEILDKDKDFYNAFIKEHYDNTSSKIEKSNIKKSIFKTRRFWMSFCSAFILVVCISTFLGIWLAKDGEQAKYYSKDNCQGIASTLAELNRDLQLSKIIISENYDIAVTLNYDTVSGDHLYYILKIINKEDIEEVILTVYVNKDYEYDTSITDKAQDLTVNGFNLKYIYKFQVDSDDFYTHEANANLTTAFEEYRIGYSQMNFEEAYGFEAFIKNCILPK